MKLYVVLFAACLAIVSGVAVVPAYYSSAYYRPYAWDPYLAAPVAYVNSPYVAAPNPVVARASRVVGVPGFAARYTTFVAPSVGAQYPPTVAAAARVVAAAVPTAVPLPGPARLVAPVPAVPQTNSARLTAVGPQPTQPRSSSVEPLLDPASVDEVSPASSPDSAECFRNTQTRVQSPTSARNTAG